MGWLVGLACWLVSFAALTLSLTLSHSLRSRYFFRPSSILLLLAAAVWHSTFISVLLVQNVHISYFRQTKISCDLSSISVIPHFTHRKTNEQMNGMEWNEMKWNSIGLRDTYICLVRFCCWWRLSLLFAFPLPSLRLKLNTVIFRHLSIACVRGSCALVAFLEQNSLDIVIHLRCLLELL